MKHRRFGFLIAMSSLCVAMIGAKPALGEPPALEVGQPFPEIVLPSMEDGEPMSIANFRGKKVVLHVFASW